MKDMTLASDLRPATLLELHSIIMDFPGVRALDGVSFDLRAGEVHVLLGENGAGKSTLINVMTGALRPTAGSVVIDGKTVTMKSPRQARGFGVCAVYQEFSLVRSMSVTENFFLGHELKKLGVLSFSAMRKRAQQFLDELGFEIKESDVVETLTRGRQQMVEIAKALMSNPKVLIFDEPTASLTEAESRHLFDFIAKLKLRGVGVVYISHRMKEIRNLADRITVMRDGRYVETVGNACVTDKQLISLMSGRSISEIYPSRRACTNTPCLEVSNLTLKNGALRNVSIEIGKGEIVGVAGLVGCGKSELGRSLFGLESVATGSFKIEGRSFHPRHPRDAMNAGVCYFPSDRATEGLALARSVLENASMPSIKTRAFSTRGFIIRRKEAQRIKQVLSELNLRPLELDRSVGSFSGGNRQKVVLARGLTLDMTLMIFDEPTVGIDVVAKMEIYSIIQRLASKGASVLLISSELPEVIGMSHRVYVMNKGAIACELRDENLREEQILPHFFSH